MRGLGLTASVCWGLMIALTIFSLTASAAGSGPADSSTTPAVNQSSWVLHTSPTETPNLQELLNVTAIAEWYQMQLGVLAQGILLSFIAAVWLKTKSGPLVAAEGLLMFAVGHLTSSMLLQSAGFAAAAAGITLLIYKLIIESK